MDSPEEFSVSGQKWKPTQTPSENLSQAKFENEKLHKKIHQQESLIESLKCDHENVVYYSEEVFKANDHLQNKVEVLDSKLANAENLRMWI